MAQLFWHLAPIERAAALIYYEPHSEMAQMVYDLKYHDHPDIGEDLGRLMANEMMVAGFFEGIDQSQTRLTRHERQENVADMFELRDDTDLRGKHVLLVDDICTTGATLLACANAIKNISGIRLSAITLGFAKK